MADYSPLRTIKRMATGRPAPPEPAMLGRFELQRLLGQGAQAQVWLAFDPRLEREVAIKLLKVEPGCDAAAIASWLREARSVSRLTHPNIVPVFEADVQDLQPYLVFEYVAAQTLSALLAGRGALPPLEAVTLMLDVLDALVAAHAAGVVHRDLKPSNVLIDKAGRARVMDFGIAARIQEGPGGAETPASGTPAYMSPEAAQGLAPTPLIDVFSAGLVLAEMLSGEPMIMQTDARQALYRVIHEQLTLPAGLDSRVDDRLRAIVLRALARDPLQRHPSAKVFRDELAKWSGALQASGNGLSAAGTNGSGTLEFLLRRMRQKSDFPALSDAVVRIQSMATSEKESVGSVTNEILKDVALTNKLLRLVNSAHYARGSSIGTVSRAVSLVGFNGIRNMALSLVLLEHMQDKTHASALKEEFLRSLMAGSIASELCPDVRGNEEAFIGAMFHGLGRLLAAYYFPEEARTVRDLMASNREPVSEDAAAVSVLGLSFEELGVGVAKAWGLPDTIQRCMRKPEGEPPATLGPGASGERQRWLTLAANDMADVLLHSENKEVADAALARISKHYAGTLGLGSGQMQTATGVARGKLIDMAAAMDIKVQPDSAASRLLRSPPLEEGASAQQERKPVDTLSPLALQATQAMTAVELPSPGGEVPVQPGLVAQTLAAGIQDITNTLVEEFNLSDVLRMILETMYRALEFQHIIFCMRDPKTDALTGRFGLGEGVERVVKTFCVALKGKPTDLFAAVCAKGADTMIRDATEAHIANHLPPWFRSGINASTFLLLPLMIKGKPFGLIYADKKQKGDLQLDEKELAMLRTLRNQAVMAFKHAS